MIAQRGRTAGHSSIQCLSHQTSTYGLNNSKRRPASMSSPFPRLRALSPYQRTAGPLLAHHLLYTWKSRLCYASMVYESLILPRLWGVGKYTRSYARPSSDPARCFEQRERGSGGVEEFKENDVGYKRL